MDKVICDRCDHCRESQDRTVTICFAKYLGSRVIAHMNSNYIEERMSGNKNHCKEFKTIK